MKKILMIFATAFVSNAIWENLHAVLYVHYRSGPITEFILLRATLVDAIIITLITLPFIYFPKLKKQSWAIVIIGVMVGVGIEWWALGNGRWAYTMYMPIIPILSVGLTPALQLGLLGYVAFSVMQVTFETKYPQQL